MMIRRKRPAPAPAPAASAAGTSDAGAAGRGGAIMIEMAIVMPVFSLMLLGIAEMSQALVVTHLVTTAARDGARLAIFDGSTNAEVEAGVEQILADTLDLDPEGGNVTVVISITEAEGNPNAAGEIANANRRDLIQVSVEVPYESVAFFSPIFFDDTTIRTESSMRHE